MFETTNQLYKSYTEKPLPKGTTLFRFLHLPWPPNVGEGMSVGTGISSIIFKVEKEQHRVPKMGFNGV